MSEAIKKSDLIEGKPFDELKKEILETLGALEKFDVVAKAMAKTLLNDLAKAQGKTVEGFNNISKAQQRADDLFNKKVENERLATKLATEKERLRKTEMQTQIQYRKEQERLNKVQARNTKIVKDETNAYKKLSKETREQKNESKRLAVELIKLAESGKRNTTEYRAMAAEYRHVTAAAKKGDKTLKKIDSTVGDNFRNVGNYKNALTKLSGALGQLGVAFGAGALLRNAGQTIVAFDQSIADLRAITGAAGDDLQYLKDQSLDLGKTIKGGAAAVVEAYKLIGSAKPELLENARALNDLTEKAITFSKASGLELPEAASRLTSALNQMDAPASRAGEYMDALANGAKLGSAEIPFQTDALLKFGAAAATSNISIQESVALIETIAPKFKQGAEAGTGLKNVLLKLSGADAQSKEALSYLKSYGVSLDTLKDKTIPFADRLKALKPIVEDDAALIKVFGSENIIAAKAIIGGIDSIEDYTEKVGKLGTTQEQANIRSKTLGEAFKNIGRAWDSFVLSLAQGEGSMDGLIDFLDWTSRNLPKIVSWVFKLGKAFAIYKTTLLALKMRDRINDFRKFGSAIQDSTEATDDATKSAKGFGSAISAIGFTALIALLTEVATRFYDLASGASRARWQVEQFEKAKKLANREARKFLENLKAEGDERKRAIKQEIERLRLAKAQNKVDLARAKIDRDSKKNNWLLTASVADHAKELGVLEAKTGILAAKDIALRDTIIALKEAYSGEDGATPATDEYAASVKKAKDETGKFKGAIIELAEGMDELWNPFEDRDFFAEWSEDYQRGLELLNNLPEVEDNPLDQMVGIAPEDIDFTTFDEIISEFNRFQLAITDILTDQIDKRIALMQKEEDAAKGQQDYLESLAAQGNIKAQESISKAIEDQRAAQEEQARLEKQKQNIELISQGLSTFNAELNAGKSPPQALASTILSTTTLVGFLKNIQFYAKGTDNAPEGLAVVDEQGAELVTDSKGNIKQLGTGEGARLTHLNKGDKVHTAKETSDILNAFETAGATKAMQSVDRHAGNSYDLMSINKSLGNIEQAVKNQPSDRMDWQGLGKVIPEFTRVRTKGGDSHTTRYKVRRS